MAQAKQINHTAKFKLGVGTAKAWGLDELLDDTFTLVSVNHLEGTVTISCDRDWQDYTIGIDDEVFLVGDVFEAADETRL